MNEINRDGQSLITLACSVRVDPIKLMVERVLERGMGNEQVPSHNFLVVQVETYL